MIKTIKDAVMIWQYSKAELMFNHTLGFVVNVITEPTVSYICAKALVSSQQKEWKGRRVLIGCFLLYQRLVQ